MGRQDSFNRALQLDHATALLSLPASAESRPAGKRMTETRQSIDESEFNRSFGAMEASLLQVGASVAKVDGKLSEVDRKLDHLLEAESKRPWKSSAVPTNVIAQSQSPEVSRPPATGATAESVADGFNLGSRLPVNQESFESIAKTIGVAQDALRQQTPGDWFAVLAADRPGGYYVLPNPLSARKTFMRSLAQFYPDTDESTYRSEYELIEPAWLPEEILRKAGFNVHQLDPTWSAVSQLGRTGKREPPRGT